MPLRFRNVAGIVIAGSLLCAAGNLKAQQEKPTAPDNTRVNGQERSKAEPSADQAKDNPSDREIMQKIRKAVTDDPALSTYAHNVKVIAQHGKVTVRGPVRSQEEKESVEQKAAQVAGAENVTSELTIKAARSKKSN
jgi:osmotically-inducible protein OsmY